VVRERLRKRGRKEKRMAREMNGKGSKHGKRVKRRKTCDVFTIEFFVSPINFNSNPDHAAGCQTHTPPKIPKH
jgi:hypothetical protein